MPTNKRSSPASNPLSNFTDATKPNPKTDESVSNFTKQKPTKAAKNALGGLTNNTAPKGIDPKVKKLVNPKNNLPRWVSPTRTLQDGPPPTNKPEAFSKDYRVGQKTEFDRKQDASAGLPRNIPVPEFEAIPFKGSSKDPLNSVYSPDLNSLKITSTKRFPIPNGNGAYVLLAKSSDNKIYVLSPAAQPASIGDPNTMSRSPIKIKLKPGYEIKNITDVFGITVLHDEKTINKVVEAVVRDQAITQEGKPFFPPSYAWLPDGPPGLQTEGPPGWLKGGPPKGLPEATVVVENSAIKPGSRVNPLLRNFLDTLEDVRYINDAIVKPDTPDTPEKPEKPQGPTLQR